MLDATYQNPFGINIRNVPITATARGGAVVVGQVVAFDLARTYATGAYNDPLGPLAVVRPPYTAATKYGILGVCLDAAADGKTTRVMVEGVCDALALAALGTIQYTSVFFVDASGTNLVDEGDPGQKCIASALETKSTPSVARLTKVLFSGLYGLGVGA